MPKKNRKQRQGQPVKLDLTPTNTVTETNASANIDSASAFPSLSVGNAWAPKAQGATAPSQGSWAQRVATAPQPPPVTTTVWGHDNRVEDNDDGDWDSGNFDMNPPLNRSYAARCEAAAPPKENFWQKRQEFFESALPQDENDEERMLRVALELSRLQSEEEQLMRQIEVRAAPKPVEPEPAEAFPPTPSSVQEVRSDSYSQTFYSEPTSSWAQIAKNTRSSKPSTVQPVNNTSVPHSPVVLGESPAGNQGYTSLGAAATGAPVSIDDEPSGSKLRDTVAYYEIPGSSEFGEPVHAVHEPNGGKSLAVEDVPAPEKKSNPFSQGFGRGRTVWGKENASESLPFPGNSTTIPKSSASEMTGARETVQKDLDHELFDSGSDCDDDWPATITNSSLPSSTNTTTMSTSQDFPSESMSAPTVSSQSLPVTEIGNSSDFGHMRNPLDSLNPQASIFQPSNPSPSLVPSQSMSYNESSYSNSSYEGSSFNQSTPNYSADSSVSGAPLPLVGEDGRIRRRYGPRRHKKSASEPDAAPNPISSAASFSMADVLASTSSLPEPNVKPSSPLQNPSVGFQNSNSSLQNPSVSLQQSSFGSQNPSVSLQQSSFGSQNPGVSLQQSSFGSQNPGVSLQSSSFGSQNPGVSLQQSNFGSQNQSVSLQQSNFGSQNPGVSLQNSSFGSQNSGVSLPQSSFGTQNPGVSLQQSNFVSQNPGESLQQSSFGSQNPGVSLQNSSFGSQNPNFGSQNPSSTLQNMTSGHQNSTSGLQNFGDEDTSEKLRQLCTSTISHKPIMSNSTYDPYNSQHSSVRSNHLGHSNTSASSDSFADSRFMPSSTSAFGFQKVQSEPIAANTTQSQGHQTRNIYEDPAIVSADQMGSLSNQFGSLQMKSPWTTSSNQPYENSMWGSNKNNTSINASHEPYKSSKEPTPTLGGIDATHKHKSKTGTQNFDYNQMATNPSSDFSSYLGSYSHPYMNQQVPIMMPMQSQLYSYPYAGVSATPPGAASGMSVTPENDASTQQQQPQQSGFLPFYGAVPYGMMTYPGTAAPGAGGMAGQAAPPQQQQQQQTLGMVPGLYPLSHDHPTAAAASNKKITPGSGTSGGSSSSSPGASEPKPYVPYTFSQLAASSFPETSDSFRHSGGGGGGFPSGNYSEKQLPQLNGGGNMPPPGMQMLPGAMPFMPMQIFPQQGMGQYGYTFDSTSATMPTENGRDATYKY